MKKVCPVGFLSLASRVLLENAKKNLVFHFGVGRHVSFPQKSYVKALWFLDNIWKIRTQWSFWWWFGSITKVGRRQQPRRNHQEWSKTSKHFYIYGLPAQCESWAAIFFWQLSKTTVQLWQPNRNTSKLSVCSVTLIYLLLVYIQSQCLTGIVFVVEEKLLYISPVQLSLIDKKIR